GARSQDVHAEYAFTVTSVTSMQNERTVALCGGVSSVGVSASSAEPTRKVALSTSAIPAGQSADRAGRTEPAQPTPSPTAPAPTPKSARRVQRLGRAARTASSFFATGGWGAVSPGAAASAARSAGGLEGSSSDGRSDWLKATNASTMSRADSKRP